MEKLDLLKAQKQLYQPSAKTVVQLDVPPINYLMIDGKGDPNTSQEFADAVEALFTVSYTLKFAVKKGALALDYGVMPLEGLWWAEDMSQFCTGDKSNWLWTAMIAQPDFITAELMNDALVAAQKKKALSAIAKLRFETFNEGKCAQTLHIGPFSAEGPTIASVHEFITASGSKLRGKHHEIYLSDIRRAAPEKWKTIVRQPMT